LRTARCWISITECFSESVENPLPEANQKMGRSLPVVGEQSVVLEFWLPVLTFLE